MHYEDKFVEENAILNVVIYKHEVISDNPNETDTVSYRLYSIQECKFIEPGDLSSFLGVCNYHSGLAIESIYPQFKDLPTEEFVEVHLKYVDDYLDVVYTGICDKSKPELFLH